MAGIPVVVGGGVHEFYSRNLRAQSGQLHLTPFTSAHKLANTPCDC